MVQLEGELDSYSAPRVRQVLDSAIDPKRPVVMIGLAGLEYIDSSGLGAFTGALKQVQASGGMILLVSPSGVVARVLQVTGLDKVFPVCVDEAQALAQLPPEWRTKAA